MDSEQHDYKGHLIVIDPHGAGHRTTIRSPDGLQVAGPTTDYLYGKLGLLDDAKRLVDLLETAPRLPTSSSLSQEPKMTSRFEISELASPPAFTEGGSMVLHLVGEMNGVRALST